MTCIPPLEACAVLVMTFASGHVGHGEPMHLHECFAARHRTGLPHAAETGWPMVYGFAGDRVWLGQPMNREVSLAEYHALRIERQLQQAEERRPIAARCEAR